MVKNGSNACSIDIGCHAGAGIADREQNIVARRRPRRASRRNASSRCAFAVSIVSLPPSRHRIARIHREIQQHVLELVRIDAGLPQTAGEHGLDRDRPRPGCAAADPTCRTTSRVISSGSGSSGCWREKASSRCVSVAARCTPAHRALGQPDQRGTVRRQPPLQQLDIAADHRQMVVEVVRDAAGELANRLHLLGLAQRFLGNFAAAHRILQLCQNGVLSPPLPRRRANRMSASRPNVARKAEDQVCCHGVAPFAHH